MQKSLIQYIFYSLPRRYSGGSHPAIPAQQSVQNPCGHPANEARSAIPALHPAIPAKSGIQHRKRALRTPLQEWPMIGRSGPSGAAMCAFRALFALDSRLRGNGRNFVHGASFLATNGAAFLPFDCVTAWRPGLAPP